MILLNIAHPPAGANPIIIIMGSVSLDYIISPIILGSIIILIFAIINMFVGKDMTPAVIDEVQKNSPAFVAGLKKNDTILSIDNKKIESILEVSTFINTSTSETIEFIVIRNNQEEI